MSEDPGEALWTWSLNVYAAKPVKDALLGVQNQFGAHIPLILWAAHAAGEDRGVSLDDARAARAAISQLSQHARALREARRHLPVLAHNLPREPREAAIAHIAEAEIALEQLELCLLAEQRTRAGSGDPRVTLAGNVEAALRAAGLDLTNGGARAASEAIVKALGVHFTALGRKGLASAIVNERMRNMAAADDGLSGAPPDQAALLARLEELRTEHGGYDEAINAILAEPGGGDALQIARLKRLKLAIKDQMTWIEDQLTPDIIA